MVMSSTRRRDEIVRVIRDASVSSQEELQEILAKKGHKVTQPTLSRDLRELGVIKTPSGYALAEEIAGVEPFRLAPRESRANRFDSVLSTLVISAAVSGTLVILRTPPAEAQPVARVIDEAPPEGVLGTLGGDDTVFVATASTRTAQSLARRINSLIGASPSRRRPRA
jgi:transcriptional regulator of arginine metabolism